MVADGMGGCPLGDVASQLAVDVLAKELAKPPLMHSRRTAHRILNEALQQANSQVLQFGRDHNCAGMGAAVVTAVRNSNRVYIAGVGDCRAYLFRQRRLQQLTTDDTLAASLLRSSLFDPDLANRHAFKDLLVRCIGTDPLDPVNEVVVVDLNVGDRLILCSDGLVKALDDGDVETALLITNTAQQATVELQLLAQAAQARDDTTCLVVDANDRVRGSSFSRSARLRI